MNFEQSINSSAPIWMASAMNAWRRSSFPVENIGLCCRSKSILSESGKYMGEYTPTPGSGQDVAEGLINFLQGKRYNVTQLKCIGGDIGWTIKK